MMEGSIFLQEIDGYSLEELELIYEQQKDLYSEEELKIIKGKIDQLKGNTAKKTELRECPKCGGPISYKEEICRFCGYQLVEKNNNIEAHHESKNSGKGRAWILLFKSMLWIVLIGFFVVGILLLTIFAENREYGYGVLVLFICIIAGLLSYCWWHDDAGCNGEPQKMHNK